ncbi:uncharacterized protein BX663DRAFT_549879 [Cokeromyces recurvatus]|uniref:uncharacterized protein n=1 Tax=Cokeromyces recurvatus TaxID=90255 RepID=UPI00222096A6|nr:uncharacterized protein BX663DRAFT_549879 [Cokeromyces recurvatus]KAI7905024.1 hypothetical protein BX663DRAFT_549879 [Cokeromyces recurvatus]
MYTLSSLPIEILYSISNYLDTEDLIVLARLNSWYTYWLSFILSERIEHYVRKEGWRIHIDILAKSYPLQQDTNTCSSFPFSTELLLLSEYSRINRSTLTLEFNLCPIDDVGFDADVNATQAERSIVLFNEIKTNIDIVAYFAQISPHKRLQHVNQAGATIVNDQTLWQSQQSYDYSCSSSRSSRSRSRSNSSSSSSSTSSSSGLAVIGLGFKIQYNMETRNNNEVLLQLIEKFKLDYYNSSNGCQEIDLDPLLSKKSDEGSAVISFDRIYVSPEWWLKQMSVPIYSNNSHNSEYSEHGYW